MRGLLEVLGLQEGHVLVFARQEGPAQLQPHRGGAQRKAVAGPVHQRLDAEHALHLRTCNSGSL